MALVRAGGDLVVRVGVQGTKGFNQSFKSMGKEVGGFADMAMAKYTHLGILFSAVGGGILMAGNQILQGTKNFEGALRNVQTVSQATRVNLQGVSQDIIAIAQATNTSAEETANGMYNVVSSGFDGADAMKVLKASLISASAGLTDTNTATRAVSAVLNAYNLNASEATDVSDILFQTVNLGVGTFEELANAVGDVAGIAAQIGVPFADVSAAIAAASRAGQNFDEAATGVNRIMQDLLDPTPAMIELLHRMGFESGQAALKQLGLQGVMESIRRTVGDNAAGYVSLFGRIEAVKTGLALASSEGENYSEVAGQITDKTARAGAAQKAFNIQMKGMNAQAKQLRNSFYTFAQSGLLPLLTMFEKVGSVGASFFNALSKLHPALKTAAVVSVLAFGAMAMLVGLLLLALPKAAVIAAVVMWKYVIKTNMFAKAAWEAVLAQNALVRAMWFGTKFFTNFNAGVNIMKSGARFGALLGSLAMIAVAFDQLYVESDTVAKGMQAVNDKMSDEDVTDLAKSYGNLIDKSKAMRASSNRTASDWNSLLKVVDAVVQTHFSLYTTLGDADKAFKELAKTNAEAALRMIESAKAAGVNENAIYAMEKAFWDAKKASEETTAATGVGASQFLTTGGQMIMISDELKEKLDELKESAGGITGAFGGIFGDASEQLKQLQENATSAADSVVDAQKNVTEANKDSASARSDAIRDQAKNQRELSNAVRELDKLQSRKPRRQRGERREDYEARIAEELADAQDKVATARQRITDQSNPLIDAIDKETEANKRLTEEKKKQREADDSLIITGDKLLARIKDQQRAQMEFFRNISKLRQRMGAPGAQMIQEVVAKGPKEGGMEAQALAGMSDTDLKDFLTTWKDVQAIGIGTMLGDVSNMMGDEVQSNLELLWTEVGGDVGRFFELGAMGGGEKAMEALRTFIANKMPGLAANIWDPVANKATEVLGKDYEMKLKLVFADDSVKIPGLNAPINEYEKQAINVPVAVVPTEEPKPPPGYGEERKVPWNEQWFGRGVGGFVDKAIGTVSGGDTPSGGSVMTDIGRMGRAKLPKAIRGLIPEFAAGGIFSDGAGLAMLHGPEAVIPMNNRANALQAMQRSGLSSFLGAGGGGGGDNSTHITHSYQVEKVVTPDPAAFEQWAANRQRMNALAGI